MTPDEFERLPLPRPTRRHLLETLAALGVGSAVFQRALADKAEKADRITPEMVEQAEWIAGLQLEEKQRQAVAQALQRTVRHLDALREVPVDNSLPPALVFQPAPGERTTEGRRGGVRMPDGPSPARPSSSETLAFLPVASLAALLRDGKVSSVELTRLYLDRLRQYDPALHCVISYTEELALRQADRADREIAAGRYRGPLHGIPWGAKDLMAVPGYKTTWGAGHFKEQTLDVQATVVRRLEEAGAVLVAKLSMGALAMGDEWFGGKTHNPWDVRRGSGGSSAGSGAATAAGLVGFALGTETLGSIVSPCTQCGVSGLRPTFGRISRHGCMTLTWSSDKIGPMARSLEDCALIFAAIHGADGLDAAAVDRPFHWPPARSVRELRVGYIEDDQAVKDRDELRVLRELGVRLVPFTLPKQPYIEALRLILNVEEAAAFDDLTRHGISEGLGRWPFIFRPAHFIPAVDYLRANRIRTLLMREMAERMEKVDAYVGGDDLLITNLTGHPTIILPGGFEKRRGVEMPKGLTFTGRLYGEGELLALGHAYQQATGFHLRRPPMDKVKKEEGPAK
jgi:Asp-tRNA(Asn)/Glu-tRNA(Gln) amidotransferase A subunit family amidase